MDMQTSRTGEYYMSHPQFNLVNYFLIFLFYICPKSCHVVYTDFRPTPLQHYMYPDGGDGIYMVLDEKGVFNEEHFQEVLSQLPEEVPRFNRNNNMEIPNKRRSICFFFFSFS